MTQPPPITLAITALHRLAPLRPRDSGLRDPVFRTFGWVFIDLAALVQA
jgi:hypothetical protein